MIRVHRPASVPETLREAGAKATQKLCERFESGERDFSFRNDIYGAPDVKATLKHAQHLKCCFCERTVGEDGHVEHFRPKAGVRQEKGAKRSETGYYWLAYEWTNLLLSCSDCNVRHKENLFPLESDQHRAICHSDPLSAEKPLFINPAEEDPEELIEWVGHDPAPRSGNPRADVTLTALGLSGSRRDGLRAARRERLQAVEAVLNTVTFLEAETPSEAVQLLADCRSYLASAASPQGSFTAMVRAFLAQSPFGPKYPAP